MTQIAFAYDAATVGAYDWQAVIAWLRRAVDVIGHKELAYQLNIKPSSLTDALLERERKQFKLKQLLVVLHMVPEEMRGEFMRIMGTAHGYEFRPKKVRTAGEELAATREALKRLAPAVLTLVDKEIGK